MTADERPARGPVAYPALRAFGRAYLHEDALVEHGSAAAAARAFRRDASEDERDRVAAEWRRFAADIAGQPLTSVRDAFRSVLGSAWTPSSRADLTRLSNALLSVAPHRSR